MSNALAFKPMRVDLDLAVDRDYQDFMVRQAFSDGSVWELFLEPERIDRTLEVLRDMKASIEQQLGNATRTQKGGEPGWRKRTTNLLRRVNIHLTEAKEEVKRLNAEERSESALGERDRWQRIAGELVDLLAGDPALELIMLPHGKMSLADWGRRRADKAARAELVAA